ncbi:GNAT family N-acetyltransferase [Flavihumibacter sp. RY-1]|uniref:GNAT family N-acetyltransferase n=1 Tax=Flavihumibacter fluminis TaxID=2909236 RepID=A0ABS9BCR8_9BACT|nr:GNAT family N-acetyltransferase [Flavihumibacter fluminis]MCF1713312.1 GNAT family N-acetyltransferase [Flavihumibacter fluminis]
MVIVKKLNPDELSEFKNLLDIFQEVFEVDSVKPADNYPAALLTDPNFMVFVVMVDQKVVAGLTVYVLHSYYTPKPVAYIYDVGVRPAFQGRGLGKQLLSEVCSYCAQNGFDHAYVEAESDDLEAVRFYRKTNSSTEMNAVHFTYLFPTKE